MSKIIIGLAGEMASGKDTVKKYLVEKYNASPYKFSFLVRDVLKILYLPDSRENMSKLSLVLRENFGEDIFSKVTYEAIKNDSNTYIAIDGIRRQEDMKYLRDFPEFKFIYIESDIRKRYERIIKREENPGDQQKTFEEFEKEHQLNTEASIAGLKNCADFVVENDGTPEDLYNKIDEIIKKISRL